ncbi:MAG: serine--tRNA ligase [bacterium]|nr:serine--tRNA ligase [bacterium]
MIDIELLRNEKTRNSAVELLGKRGVALSQIESLLAKDTVWRDATQKLEEALSQKRQASEKIALASTEEKKSLITAMQKNGEEESRLKETVEKATQEREALWKKIPNIPFQDVQEGGEDKSEIIAESEIKPSDSTKTPQDYMALMGNRIDMARGAKVSGARFTYLSGNLARLELGIASYVMDTLIQSGFTQVAPPVLVQSKAMQGMGYLDQANDEVYTTQDDLYLVGTSEQSLGAMHMDEMLAREILPLRYAAYTPCFRREAGSHGKDVKGILRLHQFNKVEMFSITTPEQSEEEHEFLLQQQRKIMDALELPYRVVRLAAGDIGSPSAKTYDIETWIPSEQKYRETHSTSNTTTYQSRRLNIRYKNSEGETQKVHMLNGTAVALSRLLIAIIENHQQPDGSVQLPACLHPYLPFTEL